MQNDLREAVARIIDPAGWATWDHQSGEIDRMGLVGVERSGAITSARSYVSQSLNKTDAILALLSARPLALGGQQGEVSCRACMDTEGGCDTCGGWNAPARADDQDEGAAGEPVAYRQWCQSDKPHQGGWWQLIDKHDGDHAIATGGGKNLRPLYTHPSPTPAADAACFEFASDLWGPVREAVTITRDRLRQIWEGDTHLVYSGNPPEPSHEAEGDLAKLANEAVEALNSVFPVPDALAALKSEGK